MKTSQASAIGTALLIGVSHLDASHYGAIVGELASPEKDAKDYELIAKLKGFQVQRLTNSEATKSKTLELLARHAKSKKAGDFFLLTFSGYGGAISNFGTREPHQLSISWCLHDSQILLTELEHALSGFHSGVNIFVIADSSSILNRMPCQIPHEFFGLEDQHRALPIEIAETVYLKNKDYYDSVYLSRSNPPPEIVANVIWLTACQINQVAHETKYNGCLTAAIKHAWNGDAFWGNYTDFFKEITLAQPAFQSPMVQTFGKANPELLQRSPFAI